MQRLHLPALSGPDVFDLAVHLLAGAFILAAIILTGRWLTELTAPRPVAALPTAAMAQSTSSTGTISQLFGSGNIESQALEGLRLTGVFTGARGGGFATIHTRTGEVPVFSGDEVAPGIILKQIEGNRVILSTAGIEKELKLHDNNVVSAAASPQAVASHPSQATPNSPPQTVRNRYPQPVQGDEE
jgi:hypothetical protein